MVTDIEARLKLKALGYNPDEFDDPIVQPETGISVPEQQNPTSKPEPKTSALGVFARSAMRNAPSVVGGVAGATAGAVAFAPLEALPVGGTIAHGVATIGSGIVGSMAVSAAQEHNMQEGAKQGDKLAQEYLAQKALDESEHPVASQLGAIGANLLAFKPNINAFKVLASRLAGRDVAQGAVKEAVKDVALGASIPVATRYGQEAYNQGTLLPDIEDKTGLALEALGGGIISQPNRLGRALMGGHPEPVQETPNLNIDEIRAAQRNAATESPIIEPKIRTKQKNGDDIVQEDIAAKNEAQYESVDKNIAEYYGLDKDSWFSYSDKQRKELRKNYVEEVAKQQKPTEGTKVTEEVKPENEQLPKAAAEQDVSEIKKYLDDTGISLKMTPYYVEAMEKLGAARNIKVESDGTLSRNGKPIAGEAVFRIGLQEALAKYNPETASLDTIPHELFHVFLRDQLDNGTPSGKKIALNAVKDIAKSPEFTKWKEQLAEDSIYKNTSPDIQVEEFLTKNVGNDTIRRIFGTDNKGKLKNWMADVISNVKRKVGKAGTDDYIRLLSGKLIHDAPFEKVITKDNASGYIRPNANDELKDAPVEYNGSQRISDEHPPFHFYTLTEDLSPTLVKGSTVSERSLNKAGYKIPEGMPKNTPEERVKLYGQEQDKSDFSSDDSDKGIQFEEARTSKIFDLNKQFNTLSRERSTIGQEINRLQNSRELEDDIKLKSLKERQKEIDDELNKIAKKDESLQPPYNKDFKRDLSRNQEESDFNPAPSTKGLNLSEEGKKLAAESPVSPDTLPDLDTANSIHLSVARPEIDKIKVKSPILGQAFTKMYDQVTFNRGRFLNGFVREMLKVNDLNSVVKSVLTKPVQYLKQETPEMKDVYKWFEAKNDGTDLPKLTSKGELVKGIIQRYLREVRTEAIKREDLKHIADGYNENYFPFAIKQGVLQELTQRPNGEKALKYRNDFITYRQSKGDKLGEAKGKFNVLMDSLKPTGDSNTAARFGPLDKAAGEGIPKSWREDNLMFAMERYLDRVSRRFAYYDTLEHNTAAQKELKKFATEDSVNFVMRDISGQRRNTSPLFHGIEGVVRATMLGTVTGGRDVASSLFLGFQHHDNVFQAGKNTVKALFNLGENIADGYKTGRLRVHMNTLEFDNGVDSVIRILKRASDVATDLSGRNFADQLGRAITLGAGKLTTLDFHEQYLKGKLSKQGEDWFKNFGEGIDWKKPNLSKEDVLTMSARYVDSAQGTYDVRGLPRQSLEGSLAPFLKLGLWNIEKMNNFMKHTITPLSKGNLKPILNTTIGVILGGAAVNEITELLNQRKNKNATYKELLVGYKMGNNVAPDLAYKFMGLASASGHAGMLSDLAKMIADKVYGKTRPTEYNNILIEFSNRTAETLGEFIQAAESDGVSLELLQAVIAKVAEDNIQSYRMLLAHMSSDKKEQIEKSNRMRDLRVFNMIEGNDITDLSTPFKTSFEGLDYKKFRQETDLNKAVDMLPSLLDKAISKSKGDPAVLKNELKKLKQNSYQTMPNPDSYPERFLDYIMFLEERDGKEAANSALLDYLEKNQINQAKASMVP